MRTRSKSVAEKTRWHEDDDWQCEGGAIATAPKRQYETDGLKWVVISPSQNGGTTRPAGDGLACIENLILMHCEALPALDKEYIRNTATGSMNLLGRHKDHGLIVGITFKVHSTTYCELILMSVNMSRQSCGYGRKSIERLKDYLVNQLDVRTIMVWADYTAIGFYTKVGFRDEVTLPVKDYRYEVNVYTKSQLMQCDLHDQRNGRGQPVWVMEADAGVARLPQRSTKTSTWKPANWAKILAPKGRQRKEIAQVAKVVNKLKTLNASFYFLGHDDYTRARTAQQPFKRRIEVPINIEYIEQRLQWDTEGRKRYSAAKFVCDMERLFAIVSESMAKSEYLQTARQSLEEEFRKLCHVHLSKFVKLKRKQ